MVRRALIFGVSGQDGWYLSELLLKEGYRVFGTSRVSGKIKVGLGLSPLNNKVSLLTVDPSDYHDVRRVIETVQPGEIYLLAGQTSVGLSFQKPFETINSFTLPLLNVLEATRLANRSIRIFCANSVEVFGDCAGQIVSEDQPHVPISPYGLGKSMAAQCVRHYRKHYGMFVSSGFLSNHESSRRGSTFVIPKIILGALQMRNNEAMLLKLGNLDVNRDWGHASEFVEAMWKMLKTHNPEDYIISTSRMMSLAEVVEFVFDYFDIEHSRVIISEELQRKEETDAARYSNAYIVDKLDWSPRFTAKKLLVQLCTEFEARFIKIKGATI